MVKSYQKGQLTQLSRYFSTKEFDCQCSYPECAVTLINDVLIENLEKMRCIVGPMRIMSGFRCAKHNAVIGGVSDSQHTLGNAADIRPIRAIATNVVAQYAENYDPFEQGGIGEYFDLNFTHLDVRTSGRARWVHPVKC